MGSMSSRGLWALMLAACCLVGCEDRRRPALADGSLMVEPGELDFGRLPIFQAKEQVVRLENFGRGRLVIEDAWVESEDGSYTAASFTLQPGESRATVVKFAPVRVGQKRAILAVAPCKGCLDQLVNLRAEGLEQAVVAIPPDVDFGQVPIDRDTQNEARLKNISTEPMDLTGMGLTPTTDPSFTASAANFPITLQPNEER